MNLKNPIRYIEEMETVSTPVRGIILAIASGAFFASMHGSVRLLSQDLDAMEIAFFRAFFGFVFFTPILLRTRLSILKTARFPLHMLRGLFNGASLLLWFTALSLVPLGDATALSLTGPLFVALGAIFILGETIRGPRWIALGVGFAGTLIIVRPGFQEINLGMILVLVSMLCVTCSKLIAKSLARTDQPSTIVAYLSLTMMVPSGVALLFVWQTPTWSQLVMMIMIGFLASCGHMLLTTAYKIADISLIEPVVFARLIWAAIVGWFMFSEFPGVWVWLGAALIVLASTWLARQESRTSDQV
jgi:drug/metabolite transporter (DMT)-like permease|tara:strand:+ start:13 stop:918 length:906 start_codon:yes stop_codon:yes gene_type:complete